MAYLRIVISSEDDLAFERIINTPKRGLGDKAQQKIQLKARQYSTSLIEGAKILLSEKGLGVRALSNWVFCFQIYKDGKII